VTGAPPKPLLADVRRFPALWAVRVLWVLLPATVGGLLGEALADAARPSQIVVTVGAWAIWAAGLTATMIRRPMSLTALRIVVPAILAVTIIAAAGSNVDGVSIVHAGILAVSVMLPEVGNSLVDGLSYGDERRVLLRVPLVLLMGPLPLTWAATVAAIAAGPLLLAARQWLIGIVAVVAGGFVVRIGVKALHGLSRRWIIFVPNGFVVHDQLSTREPFLLRRSDIRSIGPAEADTDLKSADLVDATQNATGVVIVAELREPVEVVPIGRVVEMRHVHQVAFCPTRPGAMLQLARSRRIVG
jgi:hypothetical protein